MKDSGGGGGESSKKNKEINGATQCHCGSWWEEWEERAARKTKNSMVKHSATVAVGEWEERAARKT